ncbi:MAG: phosphate/phosphite/phosphonate ABC transporter substrate-binding protein [Dermatophilus congolensis]|nr:phosphate/phosphite/phosphonate ABC transporter substrate-binding protein [Dermatophilus congolensis]
MSRRLSLIARALSVGAALTLVAACGQSAQSGSTAATGGAESKDTIVLASVPSEESTDLQSQLDGIIKLLEKETGKKVSFQQATDYAAVIEGQRAGQIDIGIYGPFSYVIAKDSGVPVEPIGAMVDEPGDKPGYQSYGWTRPDTGIKDIKGFAGKKVCFVDLASTSGYLYPSAGLLSAGIDPKTGVTPVMAGGHDASLLSIASKQCDAGFAFDTMEATMVEKGQLKAGQLTHVWTSETIAGSPAVMSTATLDADTQAKVRDAFITKANKPALVAEGICASEEDCKLPEDTGWGFVATTDADYNGIREVCKVTKADACTSAG